MCCSPLETGNFAYKSDWFSTTHSVGFCKRTLLKLSTNKSSKRPQLKAVYVTLTKEKSSLQDLIIWEGTITGIKIKEQGIRFKNPPNKIIQDLFGTITYMRTDHVGVFENRFWSFSCETPWWQHLCLPGDVTQTTNLFIARCVVQVLVGKQDG